jgi:hypothetical protein
MITQELLAFSAKNVLHDLSRSLIALQQCAIPRQSDPFRKEIELTIQRYGSATPTKHFVGHGIAVQSLHANQHTCLHTHTKQKSPGLDPGALPF